MEHAVALILLLVFEYLGDFLLQSRKIATSKSEDRSSLLKHLLILTCSLFAPALFILGLQKGLLFLLINNLVHGIIDWNIWNGYKLIVIARIKKETESFLLRINLNKKLTYKNAVQSRIAKFKNDKEYAEDAWFYNTIGLDRLLHVSTIILLYFWLA